MHETSTANKYFVQGTKTDLKMSKVSRNIGGFQRRHERRFPQEQHSRVCSVYWYKIFFFLSFKLPWISILKLIWRQKILPSQSHCSILPKLALGYSCTDFRCSEPERLFLLLNSNHILGLSPVWDLVVDNCEDSCWSRRGKLDLQILNVSLTYVSSGQHMY